MKILRAANQEAQDDKIIKISPSVGDWASFLELKIKVFYNAGRTRYAYPR